MAKCGGSEKPWERQKGESSQAFEAFVIYCDMGAERSLRKVAQKLGKSLTLIARWNTTWHWQDRVREYENDLRRQEFEEQKKDYQKMQKNQLAAASALQKKAVDALVKLEPGDLSPRDILHFFTTGANLENTIRKERRADAAGVMDKGGKELSLADTIINAYKARAGIQDDND